MYEREVKEQEKKVEQMKADGKDEYDVKKQVGKRPQNCRKVLKEAVCHLGLLLKEANTKTL